MVASFAAEHRLWDGTCVSLFGGGFLQLSHQEALYLILQREKLGLLQVTLVWRPRPTEFESRSHPPVWRLAGLGRSPILGERFLKFRPICQVQIGTWLSGSTFYRNCPEPA